MKHKALKGIILIILSIVYSHAATIHYGSNWWPSSYNEMASDCLAGVVYLYGVCLVLSGLGIRFSKKGGDEQ